MQKRGFYVLKNLSQNCIQNLPPHLVNGTLLLSTLQMAKVGQGGYGQVFKAYEIRKKRYVALKVEKVTDRRSRIDLEVEVLKKFEGEHFSMPVVKRIDAVFSATRSRHCPEFYYSGECKGLNYYAFQLLGVNLSTLRKACPGCSFTFSTVHRVAVQCIEAIRDLHSANYIHRDIKTSNFMIGYGSKTVIRCVYLIDFGLAKCYIDENGKHYHEEGQANFRGTLRYASITTHEQQHQGRKDDLWSLLYVIVEMIKGTLPWAKMTVPTEVHKCKMDNPPEKLVIDLPSAVKDMALYLDTLSFSDEPNYALLIDLFKQTMQAEGVKEQDDYDWEKSLDELKKLKRPSKRNASDSHSSI
ncbi:Pkinase domain containing protein [Trichuris trichiura]|uniref:non-specific serine/threonine protein kinase n=1 Tax=Trichuris trichiura TaxID=36087 RepID=A0A077Z0W0_TRITR|nr:Pkinase domain containing protein [Trichuris trichiura]